MGQKADDWKDSVFGHVQLRLDVRIRKTETKPMTQVVLTRFYNIHKPVRTIRSMRQFIRMARWHKLRENAD